MPNWCYQHLEISGDNAELNRFIKETTGYEEEVIFDGEVKPNLFFDFNSLVKCPDELRTTMAGWSNDPDAQEKLKQQENTNLEKYGHKNWYDWCCEVYGTKWGACSIDLIDDLEPSTNPKEFGTLCPEYNGLRFEFTSAWSPASNLIKLISGMFPQLTFAMWYTEESNMYAGWEVFRNDVVVDFAGHDPQPPSSEGITEEQWQEEYETWNNNLMQYLEAGLSLGVHQAKKIAV